MLPLLPRNDGTKEDRERRQYWKSAVWWRNETFHIGNRKLIDDTRRNFELSSPNGGLRIAAYPTGSLTTEMIFELLDTLDRTENFVPRVIFLDYVDIMKQKTVRASDKDHDGLRIIWEELRGLTSRLDLLLISPTQTNRQGDEIETHTIRTLGTLRQSRRQLHMDVDAQPDNQRKTGKDYERVYVVCPRGKV